TARWEGTGSLEVAYLQASSTHFGWNVVLKYADVPGTPSEPYLPRIQNHTGSVVFLHHETDPTSCGIGLPHSVNGSHDIRSGGSDYTVIGSLQVTGQSVKGRIAGPAFHSPD